jgi:glutathione S-transferase
LQVLEGELSTRDWLVGDSADLRPIIACCGYLFCYDEPFTFDRAAYPAIDAWLDPHRRHARLETPLRPDAARLRGRVTG